MKGRFNMKKILQLSTVLVIILVLSTAVSAQTQSVGDTLIIGPLNSLGQPIGALNEAIHGDVDAGGNRIHQVYKLHHNAQYILTEVINADFPLVIVADPPDAQNRPPIIRGGLREDGSTVDLWWRLFDHATFKNLWLTGINLDGTGPINWISQEVNTTGKTISFEGTIIEYPYTWWAAFADWGGNNNYKITDCIFMNVGNPTGTTWNGAVFHHMRIDTVIIRNTTFYNFGAFAIHGGEGTYYAEIDHNTFVNSVVHPHGNHGFVKQIWTNNLWVNGHAFSDDTAEIRRHFDQEVKGLMNYAEIQWDLQALDSLYGPDGAFGKNYDPNGDGVLTEDELVWELRNNVWWYTDPIKSYWEDFAGSPYNVVPNPWMNNYNKAMFENQDGPWIWELWTYEFDEDDNIIDSTFVTMEHEPFRFFVEENTMNVDPGIVDMKGTDELLAQNSRNIRKEWAGETFTPVRWHGIDDYLDFGSRWPINFNLAYTNTTLQTASTLGFPVGDLNWFPDKKAEWLLVNVERNESRLLPDDFSLSNAYPNPFNPQTKIDFRIAQTSQVRLTIYNVLGQQVTVLMNEELLPGSYTVTWNGTNDRGIMVPSGVYLYRIEAGQFSDTKKVVFLK
jgi:hypothetical protein